MPESIIARRALIGATVETTKGTLATVSAALANTIVYEPKWKFVDPLANGEREEIGPWSGSLVGVLGPQAARLTFRTEVLDGDATMTLLQACHMQVATGPPVVATPVGAQSTAKCISLKLWEDGRLFSMRGAAGTAKFRCDGASQRLFAEWDFMGIGNSVSDTAMPATTPVVATGFRNHSVIATLGGSEFPYFDGFEIDLRTKVTGREDATDSSGFAHFITTDFSPMLRLAPEADLVANYDAFGKLRAGTAEALVLTLEDAAGNSLSFTAPQAQRQDIEPGDRGGKRTDDSEWLLARSSSGNDALTITETAAA